MFKWLQTLLLPLCDIMYYWEVTNTFRIVTLEDGTEVRYDKASTRHYRVWRLAGFEVKREVLSSSNTPEDD